MTVRTHSTIAALIGGTLGVLGSTVLLVGSWLSLIPWAVVGLLVGTCTNQRDDVRWPGAWYGFTLPIAFMLAGFRGDWTSGQVVGLAILSLVLGLIGALAGIALALLGRWLRRVAQH